MRFAHGHQELVLEILAQAAQRKTRSRLAEEQALCRPGDTTRRQQNVEDEQKIEVQFVKAHRRLRGRIYRTNAQDLNNKVCACHERTDDPPNARARSFGSWEDFERD